ncbi:LysR substrate-binding domain-containing protein [Noviherbaspirillum aerium]|uniref:LysR substrate-binding domain-containing protein n=1 Tax=Noviherbaspirillum aerium TaxID=2588497 RepID=UPI00124EDF4C|nr:LysR substrate-binding domain-containing protein [Noviherbaspirillum aerium]
MHFDLTDLRLLMAIADTGSLSRAAAAFPLALSAASNRLRLLEQRIGLPLFLRHADGMTPTPAGRIALDHARRVVGESQQLDDALKTLAGQRRVHVRVAANTVASSTFLPPALGPFLNDFPEVDLQIEEKPSAQVLHALLADEVDLGVLDGNISLTGIMTLPFRHDRLVLFVPGGHALADRGHCLLREALGYPFVGMPRERALQAFVEERATLLGRPLTMRVRTPSFFALAQLVAQGVGLAVLPEAVARRHQADAATAIIALDDPWATRELRLGVRDLDQLSAQARQLVAYLSEPGGAPPQ